MKGMTTLTMSACILIRWSRPTKGSPYPPPYASMTSYLTVRHTKVRDQETCSPPPGTGCVLRVPNRANGNKRARDSRSLRAHALMGKIQHDKKRSRPSSQATRRKPPSKNHLQCRQVTASNLPPSAELLQNFPLLTLPLLSQMQRLMMIPPDPPECPKCRP